ncbi:unnamed protein product [Gadus morhua 'NCC']
MLASALEGHMSGSSAAVLAAFLCEARLGGWGGPEAGGDQRLGGMYTHHVHIHTNEHLAKGGDASEEVG